MLTYADSRIQAVLECDQESLNLTLCRTRACFEQEGQAATRHWQGE